jgi:hypothetical protein
MSTSRLPPPAEHTSRSRHSGTACLGAVSPRLLGGIGLDLMLKPDCFLEMIEEYFATTPRSN